jgi:hypothetical protein
MKKVPDHGELSENAGLSEGERATISFSSERGHSNLERSLCPSGPERSLCPDPNLLF